MGNSRRRARVPANLLGSGISALGVGLFMLLLPLLLKASPATRAFGSGLRFPALALMVAGAVLVAVHYLLRRVAEPASAPPQEPKWSKAADAKVEPARARAKKAPSAGAAEEHPPQAATWSNQVFNDIEWRRFEAVCEALFAQAGFETKAQSHGADGGVDIWLHSKHAEGPAAVVQCKHWQGKQVGVKELREFLGVMASHGLKRGTYATSSTFTADALRFAKDNGISALDGDGLLALIAKRTPEQQQALLATAYEGEYWKPTCARCGVKMVDREKKKGDNNFWGCPRFPRCRATLPMRGTAWSG